MAEKVIKVHAAVKADGATAAPKSDAGIRTVPIPPYLFDRLQKIEHGAWDFVCTNLGGGQLTKSSCRKMWQSFKKSMNIAAGCKTYRGRLLPPIFFEDLVLYDYRHTYATDLQAAGVPINVARELLGHKDISTTAHVYTHHSDESVKDAANKIASHQASLLGGAVAPDVAPDAESLEK